MVRSKKRRSSGNNRRKTITFPQDKMLRQHLLKALGGGQAHVEFAEAIAGLPPALRGTRPPGAPYSLWELLEHLRIAQWDILEFIRTPKHVSPKWPEGYWPASEAPPNDAAWEKSIGAFRKDHEAIIDLLRNPQTDLFARIAHGQGQTILREALLVADHNAYHLGQFVLARRLLGAWRR